MGAWPAAGAPRGTRRPVLPTQTPSATTTAPRSAAPRPSTWCRTSGLRLWSRLSKIHHVLVAGGEAARRAAAPKDGGQGGRRGQAVKDNVLVQTAAFGQYMLS